MEGTADITREEWEGRGRYLLPLADEQEAYLSFRRIDGGMVIDYSFVPPAFRGRGIAAKLVRRAVEDARASGEAIVPACGYVAAEFRRHRDWQDVLAR